MSRSAVDVTAPVAVSAAGRNGIDAQQATRISGLVDASGIAVIETRVVDARMIGADVGETRMIGADVGKTRMIHARVVGTRVIGTRVIGAGVGETLMIGAGVIRAGVVGTGMPLGQCWDSRE